jgi:hypothetical protein
MPSCHSSITVGLITRICSGWTTRFLAADRPPQAVSFRGRRTVTGRRPLIRPTSCEQSTSTPRYSGPPGARVGPLPSSPPRSTRGQAGHPYQRTPSPSAWLTGVTLPHRMTANPDDLDAPPYPAAPAFERADSAGQDNLPYIRGAHVVGIAAWVFSGLCSSPGRDHGASCRPPLRRGCPHRGGKPRPDLCGGMRGCRPPAGVQCHAG